MVKKITAKLKEPVRIGIIGGSGVYDIDGITDVKEIKITTPFGNPSDPVITGKLDGVSVAFLPRHGHGHRILPTEINQRANIYALKSIGVEQIISISACGSLKEQVKPRDFVIPDQLFDRTKTRASTFFGNGIAGHVGFAHPYCPHLIDIIYNCCKNMEITVHKGGTYVCIEGPQFSTKAESIVNRSHGFDIIGMTSIPEAKLAREAEICYATIGLVTDYDVWKDGEEVDPGSVVANVNANVSNVKQLIKLVVPELNKVKERDCECAAALKNAVYTDSKRMNKKTYNKLKLLIGKYVKI